MLSGAAIITGGASGLGAATAAALHRHGTRVVVADLDDARGERLAAELGDGAVFVSTDVRDAEQVERAVHHAAAMSPDGLRVSVACAGIGPAERMVGKRGLHRVDRFEHVLAVNLIGTFNLLRAAAGAMAGNEPHRGERGLHVSTASGAAYEGQVGQVAYAASKAGVVGMTLPAARDLAEIGVRVCAIAPGIFDTPLLASLPDDVRTALAATVPFPGRLGEPEEFAALVVALAENRMINGETVRIDGALRMAPR